MKISDFFEATLRVVGLVFVIFGIADLLGAAARFLGLPMNPYYTLGMDVTGAGAWIILGIVVIAAAPRVTRMFYGRDSSD